MLPDSDRLPAGDLFLATLNGVMPVLLLLATGIAIGFLKLYPPQDYPKLSSLIFRFTFPAAMVYTIGKMNIGRDELLVIAAHFASIFLALPISYAIGYKLDRPARSIASVVHTWSGSTFSNSVVIGVPIINSMFGEDVIYFCSIHIIATGTSLAFFYFCYELDKERNAQLAASGDGAEDAEGKGAERVETVEVADAAETGGTAVGAERQAGQTSQRIVVARAGSHRPSIDGFFGPKFERPGYRFSCSQDGNVASVDAEMDLVPLPVHLPRSRRGTITGQRPSRISIEEPAGRARASSLPPGRLLPKPGASDGADVSMVPVEASAGGEPRAAKSRLSIEGGRTSTPREHSREGGAAGGGFADDPEALETPAGAAGVVAGADGAGGSGFDSGLGSGPDAASPAPAIPAISAAKARPKKVSVCHLVGRALLNTIKVPVVISIFLGVIYNLIATFAYPPMKTFPPMLNTFLVMLSNITGPIGTIMLGLFLVFLIQTQIQMKRDGVPMPGKEWGHEFLRFSIITLMRQLGTPLLLLGLLYAFRVDPHKILVNSIINAMPAGTLAMTLSDTYKYHNISMGLACIVQVVFLIFIIPIVYYICLAILG